MSEVVKAVTERIEILGDKMKQRKITPIDAEKELESIMKEIDSLDKDSQIVPIKSLLMLVANLEEDRRRRKQERIDALRDALKFDKATHPILEILTALEGLNEMEKDSNDKDITKCDGDCKNCRIKTGEEKVKVRLNIDDLDEDEKEEIIKAGKEGRKSRDLPVVVNQYQDVTEVIPQVNITKFDLSLILKNLKNDYKEQTIASGIVRDKEDKVVGLHIGFLFDKDIIVNLEKIELNEEKKEDFCKSFIEKYIG